MNGIQPRVSATLFINTATHFATSDLPHPDRNMRVIVLRIADDLTLHFSGNDEEVAATAGQMQRYLEVIRKTAAARSEADELESRDALIDAGIGTGYIGEFR